MTKNGKCWICGDFAENGQEGYSSDPMILPGFINPVWVCGMCIIRALSRVSLFGDVYETPTRAELS